MVIAMAAATMAVVAAMAITVECDGNGDDVDNGGDSGGGDDGNGNDSNNDGNGNAI